MYINRLANYHMLPKHSMNSIQRVSVQRKSNSISLALGASRVWLVNREQLG